jgi:hypothetical protein
VSGAWDADCGAQGAAAGRLKTCCLRADGRAVVAQARPPKIRRRPDFYEAVIDASLPGSHPAGQDGGDLVAGDAGRPHPQRQQRPHRGLQRLIKQTKRLGYGFRSQITNQRRIRRLPLGHPTAKISSMSGSQPPPFKFEEPVRWGFLFAWFLTAFFSIPE